MKTLYLDNCKVDIDNESKGDEHISIWDAFCSKGIPGISCYIIITKKEVEEIFRELFGKVT